MRKALAVALFLIGVQARAQVAITATSVVDSFERPLAAARLCFTPVNAAMGVTGFRVGSSQIVPNEVCGTVSMGALQSGLSLAPTPTGMYYHVYVKTANSNAVLRDYGMTPITGSSWTLDAFDPNTVTLPVAALTMGTITNLSPGSGGSCGISGGSGAYLLNCSLPEGAPGATGATGATGPTGPTGAAGTPAVGSIAGLSSDGNNGITVAGAATLGAPYSSSTTNMNQAPTVTNVRNVASRSVKEWGAVGNGTTDDTTAIESALTWEAANSGCVYFPAGTYLTTAMLDWTSTNRLCLQGEDGRITTISYGGTSTVDSALQVNANGSYTSLKIDHLGITANTHASYALHGVNVYDAEMDGDYVWGGSSSALEGNDWNGQEDIRGLVIKGNQTNGCVNGATFDAGTLSGQSIPSGQFTIVMPTIEYCTATALNLVTAGQITVINSQISQNGQSINIAGGTNTFIGGIYEYGATTADSVSGGQNTFIDIGESSHVGLMVSGDKNVFENSELLPTNGVINVSGKTNVFRNNDVPTCGGASGFATDTGIDTVYENNFCENPPGSQVYNQPSRSTSAPVVSNLGQLGDPSRFLEGTWVVNNNSTQVFPNPVGNATGAGWTLELHGEFFDATCGIAQSSDPVIVTSSSPSVTLTYGSCGSETLTFSLTNSHIQVSTTTAHNMGFSGYGIYIPSVALTTAAGVGSINGVAGAFTFAGSGVTCSGTTCTFTGTGGSMVYPSAGFAYSSGSAWATPTSAELISLLGYTPYNAANPSGYLTSSALSPYMQTSAFTASAIESLLGSSTYDAYGAASTAQSTAEASAANASNLASGTVAAARMPALTGDATTSAGSTAVTVKAINGVSLSGLASGPLCNTTSTGVPVTCTNTALQSVLGTSVLNASLTGISGSLGGSSLSSHSCTTTTVTITGATTSPQESVGVSPSTWPGTYFWFGGYVSAANTVTVELCNLYTASETPTAATYAVTVTPLTSGGWTTTGGTATTSGSGTLFTSASGAGHLYELCGSLSTSVANSTAGEEEQLAVNDTENGSSGNVSLGGYALIAVTDSNSVPGFDQYNSGTPKYCVLIAPDSATAVTYATTVQTGSTAVWSAAWMQIK